ncbi:MAG: hypothetical protein R2710_15120 [Acidimicrobiales bacterium]
MLLEGHRTVICDVRHSNALSRHTMKPLGAAIHPPAERLALCVDGLVSLRSGRTRGATVPKIMTRPAIESEGAHVDLDFRDTTIWTEFSGIPSLSMLFGDEEAGPYVFLSASVPMEEQMPTGFSHAHPSDNWRISVRGTTNMGRDSYGHGEFRFHDGGVPYASDNLAWGPEGGFGLVLMGDRRGFAITPVKAEVTERVEPTQVAAAKAMGIERLDPCPGAPAIRTTAGGTSRAHLNGGFGSEDGWIEAGPGVKAFVGLLGEPVRAVVSPDRRRGGDRRCLARSHARHRDPDRPDRRAVEADGVTLEQGSVRLDASGVAESALAAGSVACASPRSSGIVRRYSPVSPSAPTMTRRGHRRHCRRDRTPGNADGVDQLRVHPMSDVLASASATHIDVCSLENIDIVVIPGLSRPSEHVVGSGAAAGNSFGAPAVEPVVARPSVALSDPFDHDDVVAALTLDATVENEDDVVTMRVPTLV